MATVKENANFNKACITKLVDALFGRWIDSFVKPIKTGTCDLGKQPYFVDALDPKGFKCNEDVKKIVVLKDRSDKSSCIVKAIFVSGSSVILGKHPISSRCVLYKGKFAELVPYCFPRLNIGGSGAGRVLGLPPTTRIQLCQSQTETDHFPQSSED